MQPFEVKGTPIGRAAFGGWGDGEPGLVRALWCLVQHLRPMTVIETGVARGFTSRFILETLERNGGDHFWTILVGRKCFRGRPRGARNDRKRHNVG